jgi:hypothetical protein
MAKQEAAREKKKQNAEDNPTSLSHSISSPASGSAQGLGELRFRGHRPCPKCLEGGHLLRNCPNPPRVHLFTCCAYWGQHRLSCHARHCYVPESQNPLPPVEQPKPQTPVQQPESQTQTTEPQSTVTETPFRQTFLLSNPSQNAAKVGRAAGANPGGLEGGKPGSAHGGVLERDGPASAKTRGLHAEAGGVLLGHSNGGVDL